MGTRPLIIAARYKLLLALPFLIILPIAVTLSLMNRKTEYVSYATMWAEPSALVDVISNDNLYISEAQNRVNDLNELLGTDAFALDVAERIGMPLETPEEQSSAMWAVRNGTSAYPNGRHLIVVTHTGADPRFAQTVVDGVVAAFRESYKENTLRNAENAKEIAQARLIDEEAALEEAKHNISTYIQSQPPTATLNLQPRYLELDAELTQAQNAVNTTQDDIANIETLSKNTTEGLERTLRVIDQPSLPLTPATPSKRTLLAIPIAGFLLAMSIAAGVYAFLLKTDNNIRIADDLRALAGLPLLGTVPDVSALKRRSWPNNFFRVAVTALGLQTR